MQTTGIVGAVASDVTGNIEEGGDARAPLVGVTGNTIGDIGAIDEGPVIGEPVIGERCGCSVGVPCGEARCRGIKLRAFRDTLS